MILIFASGGNTDIWPRMDAGPLGLVHIAVHLMGWGAVAFSEWRVIQPQHTVGGLKPTSEDLSNRELSLLLAAAAS